MKKITMFFAAMLFALVAFAQDTEVTVPEVTTMDALKANEGKRVLYKGLEPTFVERPNDMMYPGAPETIKEAYMPDGTTNLTFANFWGNTPLKMDVYGTYSAAYAEYEWEDPKPTFVIDSIAQIHKFATFGDMADYLSTATEQEKNYSYEVSEPVVVSLVNPMGQYYVQYEMWEAYLGVLVQPQGGGMMPLTADATPYVPTVGDKITVKGMYRPAVIDEETERVLANALFVAETATLVSQNNNVEVYKIEDPDMRVTADLSGAYVALMGGRVVEKEGSYFYERKAATGEYDEDWNSIYRLDSIPVTQAGPIDLSKASDLALCGIFEFDTYTQAFQLYAVEYRDTRILYDNIAAILAEASPMGADVWYLANPVAVTCIAETGVFVEDKTGALFLMQDELVETVAVGDSIVGVGGYYNPRAGFMAPVLMDVNFANVRVLNSNNVLVPTEVTIAELLAEYNSAYTESEVASKWASRLVTIKDVTTVPDAEDEKLAYFVQGEDRLVYSSFQLCSEVGINEYVTTYGYKFYNKMNLTGVVDFACVNGQQNYSFFPRSQADIVEVKEGGSVNVENVELTDIYTENGLIVVDGEFQIFTITGQNVTNMNGKLQGGVYVVRTANATAKVVVK